MTVLTTNRLLLRKLTFDDAPFVFDLVNDPLWIRFIGDRGVRTLDDARGYIEQGPMTMYAREGFGLYLVELQVSHSPIGLCGLIRRAGLQDVDIGYAFAEPFRGQGYAYEAAAAVIRSAKDVTKLTRVVAIVSPDNVASIKLLEKLGMHFEHTVRLPDDEDDVKLYALAL
jgi:RimJ/RimL family protein N-acetyltransferase